MMAVAQTTYPLTKNGVDNSFASYDAASTVQESMSDLDSKSDLASLGNAPQTIEKMLISCPDTSSPLKEGSNNSGSTFQFIETEEDDGNDLHLETITPKILSKEDDIVFLKGVIMSPYASFAPNLEVNVNGNQRKSALKRCISDDCMVKKEHVTSAATLSKSARFERSISKVFLRTNSRTSNESLNSENNSEFDLVSESEEAAVTKSDAQIEHLKGAIKNQTNGNNVSWDRIEVREYDITIGDNPCVSYGPPIGLDWRYTVLGTVGIDEFEENRHPRRNIREMMMNYYHRVDLLESYDFTENDVKIVMKDINRVKMRRAFTNACLPYAKVEEVVASALRKTKRAMKRTKSKNNELCSFDI